MNKIVRKIEKQHNLSLEELVLLIGNDCYDKDLFEAADRVRQKYVGDGVHLRGLIEFSNVCSRSCFYCGLRCENRNVNRYSLGADEIISLAGRAKELGYKTVVLQSGESSVYSVDKMVYILREIKKFDLAITLSIGEKSYEEYKQFKNAGADRFLLRIETTDTALYKALHPDMDFSNRVKCLRNLKKLGYEVGTGCLIGLPSQTPLSLARDLLFFREIGADMIGLGPFIPNPDTPLSLERGGTFEMARKVMALVRLLMPDINIPATTAMETLSPDGRILALQSGANVVMPNVTDFVHKKYYNLYPGKSGADVPAAFAKRALEEKIEKIGRFVSEDFGFRKKNI